MKIRNADGRYLYSSQISQSYPDGIHFYGESGVRDRLTLLPSGEYVLRRKDNDLTYRFATDGSLSLITDPNGNTLTGTHTGGLLTLDELHRLKGGRPTQPLDDKLQS